MRFQPGTHQQAADTAVVAEMSMLSSPSSQSVSSAAVGGHHRRHSTDSSLDSTHAHHHPHHHTKHGRHSSTFHSLSSVDLQGGSEYATESQQKQLQAEVVSVHKLPSASPATLSEVANASRILRHTHARVPTSYAAQAYREFLHSTSSANSSVVTSAASSAAGSVVSSRHSSRPGSGTYSVQTVSAHSSRTASPSSKKEDSHGLVRTAHPSGSPQYHETILFPHSTATATVNHVVPTASQLESTISFSSMVMTKSASQDSLDEMTQMVGPPRIRPNHFTFCQEDIMKSFIRAAERDRARAEREAERERAREHQKRLEMEQEHERRKAAVKEAAAQEAAAREAMYQSQARSSAYSATSVSSIGSNFDTVGDDFSSDEEMAPLHRRRDGRRFPPVPAHFRFSTHDVNKSTAKTVQRQNIGHWSTFPRSGTVMVSAAQLRAQITALIHQQQREAERHQRAAAATKKYATMDSMDSTNARVVVTHGAGSRRASLPSQLLSLAPTPADLKPTAPLRAKRPTHVRSNTVVHVSTEKLLNEYDKMRGFGATVGEKISSRGEVTDLEKNTTIRRASIVAGSSALPIRTTSASDTSARGLYDSHGAAVAAAVAASRRLHSTLPLVKRLQPLQADQATNGHTASAPTSTNHSPQQLVANGTTGNGRLVQSTHVSPTRLDRVNVSSGTRSGTQHTPRPPASRKASLGGSEGKSISASTSPVLLPSHTTGVSAHGPETLWPHQPAGPYEKAISASQPHHYHGRHLSNGLYKDVPSSGYGQQPRGQRL